MADTPDSTADRADDGTPAPFLAALVIIVFVVAVITVLALTDDDGVSDEQQVARALVGQNDALQRDNPGDYRSYTCAALAAGDAQALSAQREAKARSGARYVDDVTDIRIDGDRATATVQYSFERNRDDKRTAAVTAVREDGAWKVCSGYP
ncbi:lumazine-binding protein [Mycobacterium sp. MYCO198283]|uniref:Rv0361 family membrane protein n=1 Tax=Mycobacterium sp. MYCO198283 TaxID=2883505 RepID=UPI001E55064C|nr:lumazine-binding protein [Mycobacterium sp. MYCO198283]MCG5432172.1 lumazine-binding protein [Mycobacterium sp. MYCO198283]